MVIAGLLACRGASVVGYLCGWVAPDAGDQVGDVGWGLQERPDVAGAGEDDQGPVGEVAGGGAALLAVCIRVAGATAGQPTITLHWDFICTTCRLRTGWLPMKHRPDGRAVRVIGGGARYRRAGSAGVALHPGGVMGAQGSVEVTADGGHGDGGATKLCQEVHGSGPPTTANCTGSVWPGRPGALAQRRRGPAHRDPSRRFLARARWPRLS